MNSLGFRNSSRSRPLNDSISPLSVGFPGRRHTIINHLTKTWEEWITARQADALAFDTADIGLRRVGRAELRRIGVVHRVRPKLPQTESGQPRSGQRASGSCRV